MSAFRFPAVFPAVLAPLSLIGALVIAPAPDAKAQTADQRAACQGDAKKLCVGVSPGGGRILECLAKQKDKLTDPCKAVVAAQGK
jgi:hypothetical protein